MCGVWSKFCRARHELAPERFRRPSPTRYAVPAHEIANHLKTALVPFTTIAGGVRCCSGISAYQSQGELLDLPQFLRAFWRGEFAVARSHSGGFGLGFGLGFLGTMNSDWQRGHLPDRPRCDSFTRIWQPLGQVITNVSFDRCSLRSFCRACSSAAAIFKSSSAAAASISCGESGGSSNRMGGSMNSSRIGGSSDSGDA